MDFMKKTLIFFVLGGMLGLIGGAGGMLIAFPFIFPPAAVNETVSASVAAGLIGRSHFREGVGGQDGGHWGRGGIKVYHDEDGAVLVEFQENFEVGAGPNFWLYLNSRGDIDNEDDFLADSARLRLQKIKSFTGSQVYKLDAAQYAAAASLTIWCESFNQYIASANLP